MNLSVVFAQQNAQMVMMKCLVLTINGSKVLEMPADFTIELNTENETDCLIVDENGFSKHLKVNSLTIVRHEFKVVGIAINGKHEWMINSDVVEIELLLPGVEQKSMSKADYPTYSFTLLSDNRAVLELGGGHEKAENLFIVNIKPGEPNPCR